MPTSECLDLDALVRDEAIEPHRKVLMMVLCLALRDRATELTLECDAEGEGPVEGSRMTYVVDGIRHDLVPPPREVVPQILDELRRLTTGGPLRLAVGGRRCEAAVDWEAPSGAAEAPRGVTLAMGLVDETLSEGADACLKRVVSEFTARTLAEAADAEERDAVAARRRSWDPRRWFGSRRVAAEDAARAGAWAGKVLAVYTRGGGGGGMIADARIERLDGRAFLAGRLVRLEDSTPIGVRTQVALPEITHFLEFDSLDAARRYFAPSGEADDG